MKSRQSRQIGRKRVSPSPPVQSTGNPLVSEPRVAAENFGNPAHFFEGKIPLPPFHAAHCAKGVRRGSISARSGNKESKAPHQLSNARSESVSDCLNREQCRIFHTALNAAQKSSVNTRFGGKGLLGQLSVQARLPNTFSKLLRNVMPHSRNDYQGTGVVAVGYSPQSNLTVVKRSGKILRNGIDSCSSICAYPCGLKTVR